MNLKILIPLFIYIFLSFIISYFSRRKQPHSMESFFLGERKINPVIIGISSAVAARGSWLLLGITTQAYILGLSAVWLIAGFIFTELVLGIFLAPLMSQKSHQHHCITIPDMFSSCFKDNKNTLRIISSFAILFFILVSVSAQLSGGGKVFYALFGLPASNGIIITGIAVLLITVYGGYKTLSYLDILNAVIIAGILIAIPVIILIRKDGFEQMQAEILLSKPEYFNIKALTTGILLGFISIGLGSAGNPHVLMKYMSVSNRQAIPWMVLFTLLSNILLAGGALCLGIFARAYFPAEEFIPGADAQNVFIGIGGLLLTPIFLGLILTSVFASVVSAAGSQTLVSAATLINDFYQKILKKNHAFSQSKLVFFSRIAILAFVYTAILAGSLFGHDYYNIFLFAWAGFGATLGPAILMSLFWKDSMSEGIIAGMITGAVTVIIWKSIPFLADKLYELFPGIVFSFIAIVIGSYLSKAISIRKYNRRARYRDIRNTQ